MYKQEHGRNMLFDVKFSQLYRPVESCSENHHAAVFETIHYLASSEADMLTEGVTKGWKSMEIPYR